LAELSYAAPEEDSEHTPHENKRQKCHKRRQQTVGEGCWAAAPGRAEQLLGALPPRAGWLLALLGKEGAPRWQRDSLKRISKSEGMA